MISPCWLCVCVSPPNPVTAQRVGNQLPAATNENEETEELLDVIFLVYRVVSNSQYVVNEN
jgi:hypothetical protein